MLFIINSFHEYWNGIRQRHNFAEHDIFLNKYIVFIYIEKEMNTMGPKYDFFRQIGEAGEGVLQPKA